MFRKWKYLYSSSLISLGLFIIVLYAYRLNFPTIPYFDEIHYTKFYHDLIHNQKYDFISTHPLLWGLLTWPFLTIFGEAPAVWRIISLLAGLLTILGVYFLTKRIFRDTLVALFAVFFFTFDCISFTQARIAMMNSLALLFMIFSLYVFLGYWLDKNDPKKSALLGTGICLGLAISTKLAAISMVLMVYFLFLQKLIKSKKNKRKLFFDGMVFLFIIPLIIYFAVYSWLLFLPGYSWQDIWYIHNFNLHFNLEVAAPHRYSSSWWGWPLLLRPIWFYFTNQKGMVNGIICIGNPAIFGMIPVIMAYLLWDWIDYKRLASIGLIFFGFLGSWLFYAPMSRLTYFHYFYFSMPFVAMGLAWVSAQLWQTGRLGKSLVSLYMILVLGMFIYWYPLLTGLSISQGYYQNHMWFPSWI